MRPDIVFTRWRVAIFVDGCFWHGCAEHGTNAKTNAQYWQEKIVANQHRDARNTAALQEDGWLVLRIWEHESTEDAVERVVSELAVASRSARG